MLGFGGTWTLFIQEIEGAESPLGLIMETSGFCSGRRKEGCRPDSDCGKKNNRSDSRKEHDPVWEGDKLWQDSGRLVNGDRIQFGPQKVGVRTQKCRAESLLNSKNDLAQTERKRG